MRGDVGVRAAPFRLAALVVPALADRLGAGVGDEMVIDVVHPGGDRVGGQHRGGEHPLQRQRVGRVGDRGQPRPQGPQVRQHRQPGQRPGLAAARCLNCSVVAAPSAKHMLTADSSATSPRRRRPPARRPARPGPGPGENACSSIAPAYRDRSTPPRSAARPPPAPRRPPPGPAARRRGRSPASAPAPLCAGPGRSGPRLSLGAAPDQARRGCGPAAARLRLAEQGLGRRVLLRARRRPGRALRPQAAADRGARHAQPPPDLRVADPLRAPLPRPAPTPLPPAWPAGPARLPDSAADAVPLRRCCQRGHIRRRQPEHLRDPPAAEPSRRSVTIAKFRIAVSAPAYSASTPPPTMTTHRPPTGADEDPAALACPPASPLTAAAMPPPYR